MPWFQLAIAVLALIGSCVLQVPAAMSQEEIGKTEFNSHCRNCHSTKKGDNRLGPTMYGIFNSRGGENPGYRNYSGGLTGLIWNEATLDRFIADPASVSPSTTMIFPPVGDAAVRKRIIAYLKTLNAP